MKHLVIAAASLILVSCGNMNYHRGGKLRKVRVERSPAQEESRSIVAHEKKRGYTTPMTEDSELESNNPINDAELEMTQELPNTRRVVYSEIEEIAFSEKERDEEASVIAGEEASKSKDLNRVEQKSNQTKVSERKNSKKSKRIRIDWGEIGYYSLMALALVAIVVGLIFEPVITLAILTVLLVIAIVAICAAICWFFVELFDMFFSIF